MLHDLEKAAMVEADHVVGDMIARARKAGIATPNLRMAYAVCRSTRPAVPATGSASPQSRLEFGPCRYHVWGMQNSAAQAFVPRRNHSVARA